jgi:uncharacterized protein (DUF4415 family)
MHVKSKSGRILDLPSEEGEGRIQAGIAADEDAFTLDAFQRMRPVGRPKGTVHKEPVSLRLSPEAVAYFKSTGKVGRPVWTKC